jgi:hypothetical protein
VESKTATPAVLATEAKEDGTARYTNIKNNKQSKFYDSSGLIQPATPTSKITNSPNFMIQVVSYSP